MKTFVITLAFIFSTLISFAQTEKTQNITVTIDNIKNDKGIALLTLNTEKTFMKMDAIQTIKSKIKNGKITVTFKNVLPGTYAILAMQDENENGKMDFNNGMPTESYGLSNNPISYGPPQFRDAKFEVKIENIEMNIRF